MITNPLARLVLYLAIGCVFRVILPKRFRDAIIPWCFSYIAVRANFQPFLTGGVHFVSMVLYWISVGIVCNGFGFTNIAKNKAMLLFLIFWGYLILAALWCDFPYYGIIWFVNVLFELFLVGYFAGEWVMRTPNGLARLLKPVGVLLPLAFICYFKYGFAVELDRTGRGMLDKALMDAEGVANNVNAIGLACATVFVCLVIFAFNIVKEKFSKVVLFWTIIGISVSLYLMIRTGSRNTNLVILPGILFALKGGGGFRGKLLQKKFGRIVMIGLVACIVVLSLKVLMSDAMEIRAFKFLERGERVDFDKMSSGRVEEFANYVYDMKGVDYLIGKGPLVMRTNQGYGVGGCLSVYVTLFRHCGVIGMTLFFVYVLYMCRVFFIQDRYKQAAFFLFAAWAITGIAEGANIRLASPMSLLLGLSLALCGRQRSQLAEHNFSGPKGLV